MITNKIKILISLFLLTIFFQNKLYSFENKIIYKIDNDIVTSIDLIKEVNYLTALNSSLKNLDNKEILEISKKSIIKERIKKIEISNYFTKTNIPEKYLENLLKSIYKRIGINDLDNFKEYLKINNVDYKDVLNKIETEALWNELIFTKFSNKLKIDENKLRKEILENNSLKLKSYLLSEIVFQVSKTDNTDEKYKEILNTIKNKGFENAALKHSISDTANIGGKLDWINENSLNQNIKSILNSKKINELSEPIIVPGGFLILKINNIKITELDTNIEEELKKLINASKNEQLNQFSKIYFNKVKENIEIDEI